MSAIKKIFFFSVFVLVISLLFWGVYIVSFKKNIAVPNKISELNNIASNIISDDNQEEINGEKISLISEEMVTSPAILLDENKLIYFSKESNQLIKADFDGENKKNISDRKFPEITNVSWSLDNSKALIKIKAGENFANYFYSLKNDSFQELSQDIATFSWQTNANRIFYEYFDKEKKTRTLNVSDPNGKNWLKLMDISFPEISFSQIPKTGLLSFWNSGDTNNQTKFQSIPIVGGETKTIFENGFGADYLWNYAGDYVLVSQTETQEGHQMRLAVMNYNGGEYKNLNIPTFSSKCVWSRNGEKVFYALPGEIPDNSVLPNDYKEGKFQTADTFWKVDVKTGEKKRLIEIDEIKERYDATDLFLNQDESFLFFVNKIDGKLYRLAL